MADFDEFVVGALEHALQVLEDEINEGLDEVFTSASARTAETERAIHPWQNRSGMLEATTEPIPVVGKALDGTLEAGIVMGMDYASYLEAQAEWASLDAAWEMNEPEFERDAQATMDRAVAKAGLR